MLNCCDEVDLSFPRTGFHIIDLAPFVGTHDGSVNRPPEHPHGD